MEIHTLTIGSLLKYSWPCGDLQNKLEDKPLPMMLLASNLVLKWHEISAVINCFHLCIHLHVLITLVWITHKTHTHTHTHSHTLTHYSCLNYSQSAHTHTLTDTHYYCLNYSQSTHTLGVGDMTKIFYHGICNFISRLRYISRFIIRRVTRFGFLKKRTLQRWRNVSTDIYLLTLKNTKVQKQYCLNRLLA